MHRPNEPQHDIVAFGQETDGPLGLEARGILKFLAERPARWALYGQNNFSLRYRTLVEHFSVFLQKWRAKVEVRFLRYCVDLNAPKEPLDADAQAEADGGDDEAPPDVESDDGSVAGTRWLFPRRVLSPLLSGQPGSVEGGATGSPVSEI